MNKNDIAVIVAAVMASLDSKAVAAPVVADKQAAANKACITAFKRAGFGTVVPRVDVLTFKAWVAKGFRPIEGSKAVKVKQFRLFHKSQVRPLTADEANLVAGKNAEAQSEGLHVVQ